MIDLNVIDGVATVTLCRGPVNAISAAWIELFDKRLDEIGRRGDVGVLHIRSDQNVFCAGADLDEVSERFASPRGGELMHDYVRRIQALFARVERLSCVTVAELGGAAVGGGLELALCCDLRLAAEHAKVGLPEVRLGLLPGAGGTQRLARLCGPGVAARLILGADLITGAEAARLGIVHEAVEASCLTARAADLVARIAGLPSTALAEAKTCIAAALCAGDTGFFLELDATRRLFDMPETRERIRAFLTRQTSPLPGPATVADQNQT